MYRYDRLALLFVMLLVISTGFSAAQGELPPVCAPEQLALQQESYAMFLEMDFEADPERAMMNLFRLGSAYQALALKCGYQPDELELKAMSEQILSLVSFGDLLLVNAVGNDVDAILAELDTIYGDSFNGQLLYAGVENGLDGTPLGCEGCHMGVAAPLTEGTWTRANDIRLGDPLLEGYDVRRYLVESIVLPDAYVAEGFQPNLMPSFFGSRMDIQQLADIIAYLESQDQLINE